MRRSIIFVLILGMIFSIPVFAKNEEVSFDEAVNYTSEDIYQMNKNLVERFPDILELEVLGESYDSKPIYVIRMGEKLDDPNLYVNKYHGLIESGTHSREVANPVITSKILEDYVNDYYDDSHLKHLNVKSMLSDSVFHFIVNSNPDGYNISKFGVNGLNTDDAKNNLLNIADKKYFNYKANSRGVDLNRNYPDVYYNLEDKTWIDIWGVVKNDKNSSVPAGAYYYGTEAGSEIETQIMMDYLLKYDFRFYLSYHSKGRVVYTGSWMLSKDFNDVAYDYGNLASSISGYWVVPPDQDKDESGSGYMGDFIENNTLKPAVTLETVPYNVKLPYVTGNNIKNEYNKTYSIPYEFMKKSKEYGYYKYRVYVDGKYVRDFREEVYAKAIAERDNGIVVEGFGKPEQYLINEPITREYALTMLMKNKFKREEFSVNEFNLFKDTSNVWINYAKQLGYVNGYNDLFNPNGYITPFELSTMIFNIEEMNNVGLSGTLNSKEFIPSWAFKSSLYVVNEGLVLEDDLHKKHISKAKFEAIMDELNTEKQ